MAKDCVSEALTSVGLNLFEGMAEADSKVIKEEIEALMKLNPADMSPDEKAALNTKLRGSMLDKVEYEIAVREGKAGLQAHKDSPKGMFKAIEHNLMGSGASVYNQSKSELMKYRTTFEDVLRNSPEAVSLTKKLTKMFGTDELNSKVKRGMYELSHGGDITKLGLTKEEIKGIQAIYNANDLTKQQIWQSQHNAGIRQGKVEGYLWKQRYAPDKLRKMGVDAFSEFVEKNAKLGDMFSKADLGDANLAKRQKIYKDIYEKMTDLSQNTEMSSDPVTSALRAHSKSRQFIWKNGDAAFQADTLMANPSSALDTINSDMRNAANIVSVRSNMSAFPQTYADNIISEAKNLGFKATDAEGKPIASKASLDKLANRATEVTKMLTQKPVVEESFIGYVADIIRTGQMLKLGATAIRQAPMDIIPSVRTYMANTGNNNAMQVMYLQAKSWFGAAKIGLTDRQASEVLGLMYDSTTSGNLGRFDEEAISLAGAGKASAKVRQGVGKFLSSTGLDYITNINRAASYTNNMAVVQDAFDSARNGFKDLTSKQAEYFNDMFKEAKLSSDDVNFINKNMKDLTGYSDSMKSMDGMLNVDKISTIDLEKIDPTIIEKRKAYDAIKPEADKVKKKLADLKATRDKVAAPLTERQNLLSKATKDTPEYDQLKAEIKALSNDFDVKKAVGEYKAYQDSTKDVLEKYQKASQERGFALYQAGSKRDKLHRKMKGYMIGLTDKSVPVSSPRYTFKVGPNASGVVTTKAQLINSMFMFKDTIYNMTMQTVEDVQKHYAKQGLTGVALSSASLTTASFAYFCAIDTLYSALMNKEPVVNKFLKGDTQAGLADFLNRSSPAPIFSDPLIRAFLGDTKFNTNMIAEQILGPVGATAESFLTAATSKKGKGEKLMKASLNNMGLNHWAIDGLARQSGINLRQLTDSKKMKINRKTQGFRLDGR